MSKKAVMGIVLVVLLAGSENLIAREKSDKPQAKLPLGEGWLIKSSTQVEEGGEIISTGKFVPDKWHPTSVPSTVLNALVKNGVYPDPRAGLNNFLIPDASDEFNKKHDLAKYSHLPGKENPWNDPYWYRTKFRLPESATERRVWLNFDAINYRADVWLNGNKVADHKDVVGAFTRFRFDITEHAKIGESNCLAVKMHQVDHPGIPDTQLDVFGKVRSFLKEITKDVTNMYCIGGDCMPTVRDRNMGIWQAAYIDFTGPVDIRIPFVITDLPLPRTSPAYLTISAELVNVSTSREKGVLKGTIIDSGTEFHKQVELGPGETKKIVFSPDDCPQMVVDKPRLWWPKNYGGQNLYNLSLRFETAGGISDEEKVTFAVRKVTSVLHELDGAHGRRLLINGKKIFCTGGYIQPEMLFDWDAKRIDTEVRYLTEANLSLVYFRDPANPPDEFLSACDRHGLMFGSCYYGCHWMTREGRPEDVDLLERCTVDMIKRYRNHPCLVLYMAMNEGDTREDVYEMWRKHVIELDGTRFFIPSGSFPDYRKDPAEWTKKGVPKWWTKRSVPEWIKQDTPVGMNDFYPKSYAWQAPSTYYRWVREERNWMFMMENTSASLPPISSLSKFIPDLGKTPEGITFPLSPTWAHHGANNYYEYSDVAIRKVHGAPCSVEDYCMKAHLVTANQHRAMFEAVNHRMWDITSGLTQWKVNSCWPSVQWQIYDWYLRPMVSYYYIKKACEPLHVQLTPPELDSAVAVINHHLEPKANLEVTARVYDFGMKLRWQERTTTDIEANTYKEVFRIPDISDLTPIYFVKLELNNRRGSLVSDNFYWLSSKTPPDCTDLNRLPLAMYVRQPVVETYPDLTDLRKLPSVKLNVFHEIEDRGEARIVHARVENPTDQLAFFVHLAVTKGPHGEEVLPVLWEDNYFSLLPRESKQVSATFAVEDLDGTTPSVEVGGWNIQSEFECTSVKTSKTQVRSNEPFGVTATIKSTFIDGSRIELYVDDKVVDSKLLWARGEEGRETSFALRLPKPGLHQIRVGALTTSILVSQGEEGQIQ